MNVLLKRIRILNIPIYVQLYLFDHVILPIALVWGFENSQIIENLRNVFLGQIINLRKSTPVYMLHAELGRHPIQINIKARKTAKIRKRYNQVSYLTQDTQVKNDRFLVINCQWKRIQVIQITVLNNA